MLRSRSVKFQLHSSYYNLVYNVVSGKTDPDLNLDKGVYFNINHLLAFTPEFLRDYLWTR